MLCYAMLRSGGHSEVRWLHGVPACGLRFGAGFSTGGHDVRVITSEVDAGALPIALPKLDARHIA